MLEVLLLGAERVKETFPIVDQLMSKPGTIIAVNRHVYFHSSMKVSEWSALVEKYALQDKLPPRKYDSYIKVESLKGWIGVDPHPAGIPIFNPVKMREY